MPSTDAASHSASEFAAEPNDRRSFLRTTLLLGGAAATAGIVVDATSADAVIGIDTLMRGHFLAPGKALHSLNKLYGLAMEPDGNLVVYGPGHKVLWMTNTHGWPGSRLQLQTNGYLVLKAPSGRVLWHTNTPATGYRLALRNDGNLVLYSGRSVALWASKSAPIPKPYPIPKPPAPVVHTALPGTRAFELHLLRRATFGVTPQLEADVKAAGGAGAWLDQQLTPATIADATCDAVLTRFPKAFLSPPTAEATLSNGAWDGMFQLAQVTLARQIWSKRQLLEVMVDFWSNHLNITTPSSEPWSGKMWDDKNVIRANALGRFDTMLAASMRSPAMLRYLNNAESRGDSPNENYGRELLELHTVGVDAGYGHDGVINVARTLSGHTVYFPWTGGTTANMGTFYYNPAWHYVGPVTVLGWSHPNGDRNAGLAAGDSLAKYLANHPATAKRIVTKLATRFVSDTPPASLITALTAVYLKNSTAIVPVLKALFTSAEFAASVGQKTRRPTEDAIATLRAIGVQPDPKNKSADAISSFYWLTTEMGNAPLGWAPPNGYPDVAPAWTGAGTTLARWNMHAGFAQQWWKTGVTYPVLVDYLLGATKPTTRGALIDALTARLLPGITVSAAHRTALIAFQGADGTISKTDPYLTWLFPMLVAMVLNTPYWSVR